MKTGGLLDGARQGSSLSPTQLQALDPAAFAQDQAARAQMAQTWDRGTPNMLTGEFGAQYDPQTAMALQFAHYGSGGLQGQPMTLQQLQQFAPGLTPEAYAKAVQQGQQYAQPAMQNYLQGK
jgi:hypothetical protein